MANFLAFITVFAAMVSATVNQTDDRQLQTTDASFCWKTSQTRGIGQVPVSCATGQERLGLLCYDKCPVGTTRKGLDCHSNCPAGFADQGLFCRNSEYGRGAGYPWKFGDWLNDRGMYKRCQKDHGQGKCEKWGWVVYPKCLPGYTSFGCCICRPTRPNCEALGLGGRLDLSYQILSVGQLVFNIGTAFAGSSAKALQAPADVSKVAELTTAWKAIKNKPLVKTAMQVYDAANRGKTGYQAIEELEQANSTTEDYVRIAASIASILDPTGISDVIAAYTYSTCDKVAA
ncbi:hypothetical protein H257_04782 [Aphanomyces astaci]|uniref:Uncharacterized protein n=1 Tax=Aphanomyces astaci TaxID=112090 RepID=W4GVI4_APHAT|nr:hypothetical protein H257_04782 [Aphanomyces astaci]ETV83039.1 hypothetical protein H257_04782 [Aphanomyces astaci]|eukprot:XP_009827710.1 hypothetical protein H257_04782 [Aphanomyces astaci]